MKRPEQRSLRPVRPVQRYEEHVHYPAVERGAVECGELPEDEELAFPGETSRREFLGRAVVSAAAAGAAAAAAAGVAGVGLAGLPSEGRAAPRGRGRGRDKDTRQQVSIYLGRRRLGKSTMSVRRVLVWTGNKKLAGWLRKYRNRSGVTRAMDSILRKASEKVLVDGKKLYRLERKLGAALTRHYKKKTGKHVAQPDLMIVLGRYYRPRLRGLIRSPRVHP